jgi:hypothetical protein
MDFIPRKLLGVKPDECDEWMMKAGKSKIWIY